MISQDTQKPAYDELLYWTQVVIDRLSTIIHVYSKPPYSDVFIPEHTRQSRISESVELLRRLHGLTDANDLSLNPTDRAAEDENIIADLQPLFRETLAHLPVFSRDMQQLLKSPWMDDCAGRVATELFRGSHNHLSEGIGSGLAVHGRLPEKLEQLLEREATGDSRPLRQEAPAKAELADRQDVAQLWATRHDPNSRPSPHLRTAGRID